MIDILRQAFIESDEAAISVSFLRFSGVSLLLRELEGFINRGGQLKLLTSTYLNVTQPDALEVLMGFPGIEIRLQNGLAGFHTKFYFFSKPQQSSHCWIGSSNFTKGGLSTNIEWNLRHSEPEIIVECQRNFAYLWQREDVFTLTFELLSNYRKIFKEARSQVITFTWVGRPLTSKEEYKPNEVQQEALKELERIRARGEKSAAVIAATGLGKTFLAAFDAKNFKAKSLLFIAHREELLKQAEDTFKKVFGYHASTGILAGGKNPGDAKFIFATIQSLSQTSKHDIVTNLYDYIVIDEFHHAAAPSYQTILNIIQPKFLLGLTATPERQDGHDVLDICNYNIAYEIRLPEAINRGWLVPFHYFGIADELVDYQSIKWRSGKFDPEALETALILEERVDSILRHALEKGYDGQRRATVGFCAGVRHAKFMADAFTRRGFVSEAVVGEMTADERQLIYERFIAPNDPLEWLFVSDILNEGIDIPEINSILFLRPTESSGLFLQQLGRGLRLHPDTEVLTVLDFVGHHKNAWLSLRCLNDPHSSLGVSSTETLGITPPRHCEILLEDKTREILLKIQALTSTKADRCREAYERLRAELGRPPRPLDFWSREDMPSFQDFKQAFGTWLDCRAAMGDATDWELTIERNSTIYNFLKAVEADWQAQRVIPYALLWSFCYFPDNLDQGFEEFFVRYPHWQIEKPEDGSYGKALKTLEKKLPILFVNGHFVPEIQRELVNNIELAQDVEARISYTLSSDYRLRYCGNLRKPDDLCLYAEYKRSEIINYFGTQYDPSKHNKGVIKLPENYIVLIAKIDTSGAKEEFQYQNRFLDYNHFSWQSQNQQRQDNKAGQEITRHREKGNTIHLFVQPKSHQAACYMGVVEVVDFTGNAPMTVTFRISQSVPDVILNSLAKT
jgi:superfamily II DNA or RNA helicase/HKD family nuclease